MSRLSDEFRRSLDSTAGTYQKALGRSGRSYLNDRGITDQVIASYRLGQVDGSNDDHSMYTGMICLPYITKLGGVVALKFRQQHDCNQECSHSKYLTPYPTRIYNPLAFGRADRQGLIGITEGEIDAITLDGLCGIPAVGIPGVETWTKHREWAELFRGYSKVIIFRDDDEPGERLAAAITSDIDTAHVVRFPFKDANATYVALGANEVRRIAGV